MQKQCKYENLLSAFADNELDDNQERKIRFHLETCHSCQSRLEEIFQVDKAIDSLAEIEPSGDFNRSFWEKIDALDVQQEKRNFWQTWGFGRRPLITTGLAAGLAIGLYLGIFSYPNKDLKIDPEGLFMAENLELLSDYELIRNLDLLEDWDAINEMKDHS